MSKSKTKGSAATVVATRPRPKKRVAAKVATARKPAIAISAPSIYSVHPGIARMQKWIAELQEKTGCTLEQWIAHIQVRGPKDPKECRTWLKTKHKLGTNSAWWLTEKALGHPLGMADDNPKAYLAACPVYVENMYAGVRSILRPLHDELVRLAQQLGDDVRICPCQTVVPLYRRHVFAEIKPASNKRIDLGFALEDEPFTSRLLDTGGLAKKNRITHRVAITSLSEIDLQVKRWLKQAYERDQ
jgi:hypothetical protein